MLTKYVDDDGVVRMLKRSLTVWLSGISIVAASGAVLADTGWATRSELGYVLARGNTDTENGNLKFDIARLQGRWQYGLGVDALYGSSNGIGTAQRWDGHFQADLKYSERSFWFSAVRYENDLYSGIQYQSSFSTGAGHIFMQSITNKLSAQIGAGVRVLRPEELVRDDAGAVTQRIPGERTTDAVANGALSYEHAFNSSTKLIEAFLVESGESNTLLKDSISLQVKMSSSLAVALGWQINRNSSQPAGVISRTDTLATANIVYEIKNPKVTPSAVALTQLQAVH